VAGEGGLGGPLGAGKEPDECFYFRNVERVRGEEPRYEALAESTVLPPLTSDMLTRFVEEGLRTGRPAWVRGVRQWVRSRARRPDPGDA